MRRCLLVAPVVSHATAGRIAALGLGSYELHVLDISSRPVKHRLDRYPFSLVHAYHDLDVAHADPLFSGGSSAWSRIVDTLRSRRLLRESPRISGPIKAFVNAIRPDVVVVYYAAIAIHYGRIIKRLFPDIPVVIIHNALPSTLARRGGCQRVIRKPFVNEFVDYSQWLGNLDFFVHASEGMAQFARSRFGVPEARIAVVPDYFPRSMHAAHLSPAEGASDRDPRVIFLGAPERWGSTIDNPDPEFLSITEQGIDVYSGEMSEAVRATGRGFKYPYFTDDQVFAGELAQYAHAFDAALLTYGTHERRERFRTTLPTRFFTALASGIPVAVRAGMFDAAESYVLKHGIGFAYRDAPDLRARLQDRSALAALRSNAIAHLDTIGGETQSRHFDKILDGLSR